MENEELKQPQQDEIKNISTENIDNAPTQNVEEKDNNKEVPKNAVETQKENTKVTPKDNSKEKNVKDNKPKVEPAKTESISWKCEQFFGKNWKYIATFIGVVMLVNAYHINGIASKMNDLEQVVAENNGKVVLTTTDGRAIRVMKEPLKAEYLKQTVASSLVNMLIVDRRTITNDYDKMTFASLNEVLESVQKLEIFVNNFINHENEQAVGNIKGYVQWLINAVARDDLPEHISIRNYEISKYLYKGNTFEIEVIINAVANSYMITTNKYKTQRTVMQIKSTGTFDLAKSTDENPYGLRFDSLEIIPIKKIKERG